MTTFTTEHIVDERAVGVTVSGSGEGTPESPFIPVSDVNIQDQHSPIILRPFHQAVATTALTAALAKDDRVVNVTDSTGFIVGELLSIWSLASDRWYQSRVLSIAVNAITVDTPLDFEYQIGDQVSASITNMAVNGSVTPQVFGIRSPDPGIALTGDITRIILIMESLTEPGWQEFGDLTALTNGIVLRKVDGTYQNIFNAKSNAELSAIMFDFEGIDAIKFGTYGVKGRLTFGGQNKIGVTIRINIGEDLELIVQDDLTGLERFTIIAEGHVVV